MKVIVKKDACQGHAMCAAKAPRIFVLDDSGYNSMDPFDVPVEQEELVRRAAAACPEGAIEIIES